MSLFGGITDALFGSADYDSPQSTNASVQSQFGDIFNLLFQVPELFQGLKMATTLGQNPTEWLSQFLSDKDTSGTGAGLKLPSGKFLDTGKLAQSSTAMKAQYEDKTLQLQSDFYNKLGQVPQFAGIFGDAAGNFDQQFTANINAGYEQAANSALGAGAKTGFLADPLVQAKILGPLAMQKAMYLKGVQGNAQQQALALSGAGGVAGGSQFASSGLGVSPFTQAGGGIAGLFGMGNANNSSQGSFWNSQLGLDASKFNANQAAGFGSMFFKAMGGMFG